MHHRYNSYTEAREADERRTAAARARQATAAAEEMASLDTELLASRRARLKLLYAEQNAGYQRELAEMGLSLSW